MKNDLLMINMVDTFFKGRQTLIDMFIDRHYTLADGTTDLNSYRLSIGEFTDLYNRHDESINITGLLTPDGREVYVKFIPPEIKLTTRSGTNVLRKCFRGIADHFGVKLDDDIEKWQWGKKYKIILVYDIPERASHQETTFEKKFSNMMEVFPIQSLTFNIMHHVYQPKFTLLKGTDQEYIDLLKLTGQEIDPNKKLSEYGIKPGSKFIVVQKPN